MNQYLSLPSVIRNLSLKIVAFTIFFLLIGCSSVKQIAAKRDASRILNQSEIFSNQFTGFSLFDIEENRYVASHNATLRFTPASNTKLLTMYAALKSFKGKVPSLAYQMMDSGLLVSPLGDPTFLYESFQNQTAFDFISQAKVIEIYWPKEDPAPFGSGWAWDDYIYNYQPQRSWWPIYGNTVSIKKMNDAISITPSFFKDYVQVLRQMRPEKLVDRELKFNAFTAYLESDTSNFERLIPFEYSTELLVRLMSDTLKGRVSLSSDPLLNADTLYGYHIDTLLARMLKPSDNFLAEQLLLMAAKQNGFSEIKPFIKQIKNTWLLNLTDMVWVDGSGLSRYNLIAPMDQVRLLKKCHDEYGWDRITNLLPIGGEGTLEKLYLPVKDEAPYIFAKTGTLSNNHNLSGYLIARSGKRMIFSFMNNHYTSPSAEVKEAMQQFLLEIRNAY